MVGGAYCSLGRLSPAEFGDDTVGAAGAARSGMIGEVTAPPGGLGAGRCGSMVVLLGGSGESGACILPGALRGIGGGALGFSKLSWVLLGNRGLAGGLIGVNAPPR